MARAEATGARVKPIRWSRHAEKNLADREIDRSEAVAAGEPPRQVLMRRYFDRLLQQEMLLRIVVTVYKTAQLSKYLKGRTP